MSTPTTSSYSSSPNKTKVVAGYALQQKLGSGSFAVVYKGVKLPQTEAEAETVAIKAITRTSEKLTKKVLQNLEVEIAILQTYRHKNLCCLHNVQKTERHFYLILEYCAGGDVQRLIRTRKGGRLTERLTRRLMRDLAAGLKFLWGQELIHRDIKPQNLLLTGPLPMDEVNDPEKTDELEQKRRETNFPSEQFVLKIADFGFARHLQSASLAETLCGSPLYMAPEILQHHRYDAKADLWSVGTVLFEMISGRPPFHGENHIDLLRNIQRKAVRLPPDVKVSKECVNLLRLLLNRNPLSRAGFKEFFQACDAFVNLGCEGVPTKDEGSCQRRSMDLGTIPENEGNPGTESMGTESMLTVATTAQPQQTFAKVSVSTQGGVPPPFGPSPTLSVPIPAPAPGAMTSRSGQRTFEPLVPSPPTTSPSPFYAAASGAPAPIAPESLKPLSSPIKQSWPQQTTEQHSNRRYDGEKSSEENSFVMVEHGAGSYQKSSSASGSDVYRQAPRLEPSPPSSPGYILNRSPVMSTRGDYMVVKQPKGMLSTSPGTGGALMGMLRGRARLIYDGGSPGKQIETQLPAATKMLAAAEDVGRRAVSVAHLGDNRAYVAMRLVMMNEGSSSSLLSVTPMEGIVEEEVAENDSGAVTDDSSSTEIMASVRRRRSSSATDKSMPDAKADDETDEMPFAVHAESPPVLAAGMPSRASSSFDKGTSITSSKPSIKPTPAAIRSHFNEALSCYLKALKMLKGAVGATQRVGKELETLLSQRLTSEQRSHAEKIQKRCEVTSHWLGGQFKGVLERADAANVEISKAPSSQSVSYKSELQQPPVKSVEELIYNYALAYGREGAIKQLLGQSESARASYRSAGLLAETLLMESDLGPEDRSILEGYVDGFAARITELDEVMLQQSSQQSRSAGSSIASSRRGPGVVGLVGQPFTSPSINLGAPKL